MSCDYVIVTHIPAFYKVNLYNELARRLKILVIFIASNTSEKRADDFIALEKAEFEYKVLFNGDFQDRGALDNIFKLKFLLKTIEYKKILVSGWDLKEFWYIIFTNSKVKNCLALESTINESRVDGIRGFIKKVFLNRITTVFASGKLHVELLKALKYKGIVKVTKGVGIINKPYFEPIQREYKKRFLFIGRLSNEKNLQMLIKLFNTLPDYTLTVIGIGPEENELKSSAKSNIKFVGQVENSQLKDYFFTHDIFILPSRSESWGLVVEEALYFGMPVVLSENCGACELIEGGENGYVIKENNVESIKKIILNINDKKYQELLANIDKYSVKQKDDIQVRSYAK